jgi:hypothetical protein
MNDTTSRYRVLAVATHPAPQFVFPCGNVEALAAILKDALSDRTRLQSIARAAMAHIQTWSPER